MKRRTHKRKYRRNPIGSKSVRASMSGAMGIIKPAAAGAAGALALNGILNHVPIPANLMAGKMAYVTKAGVSLLIGVIGAKVPGIRPYAAKMALGAMTVTLADLGKELAQSAGVNLSGVGYVNPGWIASPRVAGSGTVPGVMGRTGQYLTAQRVTPTMAQRAGMAQYVGRGR